MQVEGLGVRPQQVIVDRGHLKAAFDQLEHHGIDLGFEQHEVAHDHGFPVHRLERKPAAKCQRRLDGDAVERHGEIGTRKAIAVHITRHGRLSAECVVDLLPVDFLCTRGCDQHGQEHRSRNSIQVAHCSVLLWMGLSLGSCCLFISRDPPCVDSPKDERGNQDHTRNAWTSRCRVASLRHHQAPTARAGQLCVSACRERHHVNSASYMTMPCLSISWSSGKFAERPREIANRPPH